METTPRRGLVLALTCMAQFMVVLDVAIVNVALPAMQRDLGLSESGLQWVVIAYGLLLGGLLYDTLILRSPTCTARDERVATELAEITGEDIEQYGQEIFAAAATDMNERSAEALITADFKEFTVQDAKFAIGTVETASPMTIEKRIPELLSTMQQLVDKRGYDLLLFMIVDIINMRCRLLIWGGEQAVAEVLKVRLEPDGHSVVVDDLVSRKKQVVPILPRIQAALKNSIAS